MGAPRDGTFVLGTYVIEMSLWQRVPLWGKITVPYVLLTFLVALAGTYAVSQVAARTANDRLTTALVEALRSADAELTRREEARLGTLAALLARDDLLAAAARGDDSALAAALASVPAGTGWAAFVRPDGRAILSRPDATTATALADSLPVRVALAATSTAAGERQGGLGMGPTPAALAAAPVLDGTRIVGAFVTGEDLSALADDLKRLTLADIFLYGPDGATLARTLAPASGVQPVPAVAGEARPARQTFAGREYHLLVAPLRVRGESVGALATALPSDAVARVGGAAFSQLTLLFGSAVGASALLGVALAGLIARPVERLSQTARAIGAGDLTRRAFLSGRDEIAQLGQAFDAMAASLEQRERDLSESYLRTVRALAAAVDAKDPYTHGHSQRVSAYCRAVAVELGLEPSLVDEIEMGGLLHDVGKIGTPDGVLTKAGKLDDDEWALIRKHPEAGAEILRPVGFGPVVMNLVLYHHERLHGRGFPRGLRGDEIPLEARIAAVCDAYDAMTSDRSYRPSLGRDGALAELRRGAGEQFDPGCVDALIATLPPEGRGSEPAHAAD